ncbi:dnaJ homolog subfamily A member 2-like isoform X2 [Convolutriloba macropyga]|uniref:dnaJ homolog subfamily A member 2-like isoform X2 n=1 Tax=Convolutriloba macropyga TaxID=536237 RepID=UPI003F521B93
MVADDTLYQVLEVPSSASEAQIKKQYHRLAKKYHPDKNTNNNPDAEEKLKEINFAYEVLSDQSKRAMYDRYGMDAVKESSSGGSGGFDDVFGHFFGGGGGMGGGGHHFEDMFSPFGGFGGGRSRRSQPTKGKDVVHPLKVSLEDLYKGKTSKIQLNKTVLCKKCNGQGGKPGSVTTCRECDGQGRVIKVRQLGPGFVQQFQSECSACNGQGTKIPEKDRCKTCSGQKVVKETKILEVPIKKGSRHEQKIVLREEGDQQPGMEPGDVVIILAEQPHEKFSRRGDHLVYNMKITISEALCGFDHVIKHLDGRSVVLSRPPGKVMEPNGLYMIAGEGMPKYGMSDPDAKGDLYVTCDIVFPENIETAEKLEKLLPARPKFDIPEGDDVEEVMMLEYSEDMHNGAGGAHSRHYHQMQDSDSDDDGRPGVQQCQTA